MVSAGNRSTQSTLRYSSKRLVSSSLQTSPIGLRASSTAESVFAYACASGDTELLRKFGNWEPPSAKAWIWGEITLNRRKSQGDKISPPGETLKAVFKHDGYRQLWISIGGDEPTIWDFVAVWPKEKQKRVIRELVVQEYGCPNDVDPCIHTVVYKVVEKKGSGGRRFWREVFERTRDKGRADFDWSTVTEEDLAKGRWGDLFDSSKSFKQRFPFAK